MRFRPLKRRLARSSPRLSIRTHTPWPLRWLFAALVLGFGCALALWAFEKGKSITGLDSSSQEELESLRAEVGLLRAQSDRNQTKINTSDSILVAERAAQAKLAERVEELEAENQKLRDDLGFFQNLIPSSGDTSIAIRSAQAQMQGSNMQWQLLLVRPIKDAQEFQGNLEFSLTGKQANGSLWTHSPGSQIVRFSQYQRVQGLISIPTGVQVQTMSVKLMENGIVRASQSIKI